MIAEERLARLRANARKLGLVVLVWGPGPSNPDYWRKRNQIRENLSVAFPNSEILFSESDALRDKTRDLTDLLVEELAHATVADSIIVLDVSRGAHVEVDRLTVHSAIAAKMTVLLPESYVGGTGLVSHVHNKLKVVGFSEDEFEECTLASVKALSILDSVAIEKLVSQQLYD